MLIEEAKWFGSKIFSMEIDQTFPMIDIGSGNSKFREKEQPWIDEYIFKPAREKRQKVVHVDVKNAPGVDIVGDLSNIKFLNKLAGMEFKSVFCANFLEHIINREDVAMAISSIIPSQGYIFVSCPYRYPYHTDPIDTLFRPDMLELASIFPDTKIIFGEIVTCRTYWEYIARSPLVLIKTVIRILLPLYRPRRWFTALSHLPWVFKNFQSTCLVLRKTK